MNAFTRWQAKVDTAGGPNSCHPWTAAVDSDGYGWFWVDGGARKAHRWLLGHLRGRALEPGEMACHTCDNPTCCNAKHLYVGDAAANADDRKSRGRGRTNGNELKTHCKHRHPFDTANTYMDPRGFRQCRACAAERRRRHEQRRAVA